MEGQERSGKVREGHGRSYPNTRCVKKCHPGVILEERSGKVRKGQERPGKVR